MAGLVSFSDALGELQEDEKPHVLLGNGFSRAWRDDVFAYGALFERADFSKLTPHAKNAFDTLHTSDFEAVIRALQNAALLADTYETSDPDLAQRFRDDAEGMREVLVNAIASSHPDRPGDITQDSYSYCKLFLGNFDSIYTLNYDLLLYWALMQSELEPDIACDDGFRTPEEGPAEYVTWEPERSYSQNVFYLHGALHLFDAGPELQKYTWINTGVPLIDQVRDALERNLYPLFVAEGESSLKLERIRHSAYLHRGYRSLVRIGHPLFVHGFSFSDSDQHILSALRRNSVRRLFVGIHGDPGSERNGVLMERVQALVDSRPQGRPLEVAFYDSASVNIWGT